MVHYQSEKKISMFKKKNQRRWACFVYYLKIIDISFFSKKNHFFSIELSKKPPNGFEILVGQAVLRYQSS